MSRKQFYEGQTCADEIVIIRNGVEVVVEDDNGDLEADDYAADD